MVCLYFNHFHDMIKKGSLITFLKTIARKIDGKEEKKVIRFLRDF